MKYRILRTILFCLVFYSLKAQNGQDSTQLTIDRFVSNEFRQDIQIQFNWVEKGEAYLIIEKNNQGQTELRKYDIQNRTESTFLSASQLTPSGTSEPITIEGFSMSDDETKVMIFTNSKRVWRSNTKGDYWIYDLSDNKLFKIGKGFPPSSLMFAKFSNDHKYVAYVMEFNLYMENLNSGEIIQLTVDGSGDIINGTFDWVYEEEFGCRDGFRWSPDDSKIAYWQLDASKIGTFYMINNTDSIYPQIIPVQYPKVRYDPSSARIGLIDTQSGKTEWVTLEGGTVQNYLPGIQWISEDVILIQQINRKQNHLKILTYELSTKSTRLVYEEKCDTWVDIRYPDRTSSFWGKNELIMVDGGRSFIKMSEDNWRNVYKIELSTGKKTMLSPGNYDVASIAGMNNKYLYYLSSPENSTQRYLYEVDLKGKQKATQLTPDKFAGINIYNISPNGKYAVNYTTSTLTPITVHLISLPKHEIIKTLRSNEDFIGKLNKLDLPSVEFFKLTTDENIEIDGRMTLPSDFDKSKKYPVIFSVYGEPGVQTATDSFIGLFNIMLAQKGYVIINIDNRGSSCLKGSYWRKSIYRKIGRINIRDLGQAAMKILKKSYLDEERVGVWGWSGGGTTTLNLIFQYPDVFKTGIAVAAVANPLTYDNIYTERYMGLPQENMEDYIAGSSLTYAKNLVGKLLIIHGTADDNVHYQNTEMLINELIKQNKQFDMMIYPNRSHGIYEGENTRRHLFTLIINYFLENVAIMPEPQLDYEAVKTF